LKGDTMKTQKATIGSYKGQPTISLPMDDGGKYPFTFGMKKAAAILRHIDDIRAFIERQDEHAQTVAADDFDQAQYQSQSR